jgi:putative transposase
MKTMANFQKSPRMVLCRGLILKISLKKERAHQRRFKTRAKGKAEIFEYIEVFYNRQRRHSGIGYQTPQQAFENMTGKIAA